VGFTVGQTFLSARFRKATISLRWRATKYTGSGCEVRKLTVWFTITSDGKRDARV
jgi:hypothetical protein